MIGSVLTEEDGRLLLSDKVGPFVEEVARHCDALTFCGPRAGPEDGTFYAAGRSVFRHAVRTANVRVEATPWVPLEAPLGRRLGGFLRRLWPHARLVARADFVFLWMPSFSGVAVHALARLLGRPYGVYVSGDWQEIAPYVGRWGGALRPLLGAYRRLSLRAERCVVRHARFAIVDGRRLLRKFEDLGAPLELAVPRLTIGLEDVHQRADTCGGARVRLLYVGSLIRRKGVEDLVEALALLAARGRPVGLQLAGTGDGAYQAALRARVEALGLGDRVEWVGHVGDVTRLLALYRAADLFVIATRGEGFPRVITEAMSQGLPVVATAIGTIRAMLADRQDALLVPPGRPAALADAVDALLRDGALRRTLIGSGYRFAEGQLGGERPAGQLLRLLAAHGPPMPARGAPAR